MITFRKKSTVKDMMPEALDTLKNSPGSKYNIISPEDADKASKLNSKALVLVSFIRTEKGAYQLEFQSKEIYRYVQDTLLRDTFMMRITEIDKNSRIITAETDHLGIALDIIEVLSLNPHFNLSLVKNDKL